MFLKRWSEFTPNVYYKETESWVIFPREKQEMLRTLTEKIRDSRSEAEREHLQSVIEEVEKLPDSVPL